MNTVLHAETYDMMVYF